MVSLYTDGSSGQGGGKPGGWAWVIVRDDAEVLATDYGGSTSTTNNIMEMTAAIEGMYALRALQESGRISRWEVLELVSDSQYVLGIASGGYCPSKNLELASEAKALACALGVRFRWVRGHTGNTWNERCDSLAGLGKQKHTPADVLAQKALKKRKRKGDAKAISK